MHPHLPRWDPRHPVAGCPGGCSWCWHCRGGGGVSRWPVLSSWDALEGPGALPQSCTLLVWGPPHGLSHLRPYPERAALCSRACSVQLWTPRNASFLPAPFARARSIPPHLSPACRARAPCVPEGNVYLLGAAGHQALLQPEGLLLRARLGVVVPHQAPLDLETTGWEGSGSGMWAGPCRLLFCDHRAPTPQLRPLPSARRPRCAQGRCGRLGRYHSRGRT